jgi:tetratricopeptide (TPR) repeat protein
MSAIPIYNGSGFLSATATARREERWLLMTCSVRYARFAAFMAVAAVLMIAASIRNRVWENDASLWEDATRKAPLFDRGHYNLGLEYKKRGLCARAVLEFQSAIQIGGSYSDVSDEYNELGRCYELLGERKRALNAFRGAVSYNPQSCIALNNLGLALQELGRFDEAVDQFNKALLCNPGYELARLNIARTIEFARSAQEASAKKNRRAGAAAGAGQRR